MILLLPKQPRIGMNAHLIVKEISASEIFDLDVCGVKTLQVSTDLGLFEVRIKESDRPRTIRQIFKQPQCVHCWKRVNRFLVGWDLANRSRIKLWGAVVDGDGRYLHLTLDHIIPRCRGGPNNQLNYQTLCIACNRKKGPPSIVLHSLEEENGFYAAHTRISQPLTADSALETIRKADLRIDGNWLEKDFPPSIRKAELKIVGHRMVKQ